MAKDMMTKRGVSVFEFAFFRSVTNLASSAFFVKYKYETTYFSSVPRDLRLTMALRCVVGTVAFLVYTTAPIYISIGIFQVVMNMSIFGAAFLAWAWLGERLTLCEMIAMFIAFGGVALTSKVGEDQSNDGLFGIALALLAAVLMSVVSVSSRKLKPVNTTVVIFNYALASTLITGSILLWLSIQMGKVPFLFLSNWTYLEILAAAIVNYLAQNFFTMAEQNGHPALVKLLGYCGVAYMFSVDIFVFDDSFSLHQALGVLICITCSVSVVVYKVRMQKD